MEYLTSIIAIQGVDCQHSCYGLDLLKIPSYMGSLGVEGSKSSINYSANVRAR